MYQKHTSQALIFEVDYINFNWLLGRDFNKYFYVLHYYYNFLSGRKLKVPLGFSVYHWFWVVPNVYERLRRWGAGGQKGKKYSISYNVQVLAAGNLIGKERKQFGFEQIFHENKKEVVKRLNILNFAAHEISISDIYKALGTCGSNMHIL